MGYFCESEILDDTTLKASTKFNQLRAQHGDDSISYFPILETISNLPMNLDL